MKTAHTPTPWYLTEEKEGQIESDKGYLIAQVYQNKNPKYKEEDEANAKHIVKCVNMHDELIKALYDAQSYLEKCVELAGQESIDEDCTNWTLDRINEALSKESEG
jgi:hypothetical protein